MRTRMESILMPGALHNDNSCYMSIFYLSHDQFCFMVEKCITNDYGRKDFEYHEHYINVKKPSFVSSMFAASTTASPTEKFTAKSHYPDFKHEDLSSFEQRVQQLKNEGYLEVFSGEVPKEAEETLQNKTLHDLVKHTPWYLNNHKPQNLRPGLIFQEIGHGIHPFNTTMSLKDRKNHKTFAERYSYALNQLKHGIYQENKTIDLSCYSSNNPGLLGDGCIHALVEALTSGTCSNLNDLTVYLDFSSSWYYLSTDSKNLLNQVVNSPNCPPGLKIIVDNRNECAQSNHEIMEKYLHLYVWCKQEGVPVDIMSVIVNTTNKLLTENEIINTGQLTPMIQSLFARRNQCIVFSQKWDRLSKALYEIPEMVCEQLCFKSNAAKSISTTLQETIRKEIHGVVNEIIPRLTQVQVSILLKHFDTNPEDFSRELAGSILLEKKRNATFGLNVPMTGLTEIYFPFLSVKKRQLAITMINSNAPKVTYHDKLNGGEQGAQKRRLDMLLHIYTSIAQMGSLEEIEVLMEDSKNMLAAERINLLTNYKSAVILKEGASIPHIKLSDTIYLSLRSGIWLDVQTSKELKSKTFESLNHYFALKDEGFVFDKNEDKFITDPKAVAIIASICEYTHDEIYYEKYCENLKELQIEKSPKLNVRAGS